MKILKISTPVSFAILALFFCFSLSVEAKTKTKKGKSKDSVRDELLKMSSPGDAADIPVDAAQPTPSKGMEMDVPPSTEVKSQLVDLSYYFWQAGHRQFVINPFAEATYFRTKGTVYHGSVGGVPYDIKGQKYRMGIGLEYGMFQKLSLGVGVSYYAQYTDEDVSTSTGFEDIRLNLKGYFALSAMNLNYGLRMSFSPADRIDDGSANKNAFSGGNTYAPYLGFSRGTPAGRFGMELAYAYKDRRSSSYDARGNQQNYQTITEGGHILAVNGFFEKPLSSWVLGIALGYYGESRRTYITNSSPSSEDGETNMVGQIYIPIKSGTKVFVPSIKGQTFLDDQLGNRLLDAKWSVSANVDVRF